MEKETINMIVEFMKRVELKGAEVPAYTKIMQELEAEFNKEAKDDVSPDC